MMGPTHEMIAANGGVLAAGIAPGGPDVDAGIIIGALATAKLPDIDQKIRWLGHRTITHWPETVVLASLAVFVALAQVLPLRLAAGVAAGVFVGLGSHVASDACTHRGCPPGPTMRLIRRLRNESKRRRRRHWHAIPRPLCIPVSAQGHPSIRELAVRKAATVALLGSLFVVYVPAITG